MEWNGGTDRHLLGAVGTKEGIEVTDEISLARSPPLPIEQTAAAQVKAEIKRTRDSIVSGELFRRA